MLGQPVLQFADGNANLLHGVAFANGNSVVRRGLVVADGRKVDRDAVRRADLVLAAIALADGAGVVVVQHKVSAQILIDLSCGLGQLLAQRQDRSLIRSQRRMQVQNHAHVVLGLVDDLLVIRFAQERQRHTVAAEGRLDDVGDIVLVRFLIEIGQILAGSLLMALEVIIGAVGNAPELAPVGERERILNIGRGSGIEGQLRRLMVAQAQVLLADAEALEPVHAVVLPVCEPFEVRAGLAEEFAFHLLKLAGTEGKVARSDLVAERLADLAHAEGQLAAGGALDVREVHEDALRRLRPQIAGRGGILGDADGGLEHQVKLADGGKVVLAADGADNILMLGNELVHLVEAHRVDVDLVMLFADELVGAVAGLARLAVEQRVGEAGHMAGRDPRLRIHDNGRIETDVVRAFLHEFLEPRLFDVVLELNAERAVVPAVGQAAVNFGACKDKAAVFAKGNDLVHGLFAVFHHTSRPPDVYDQVYPIIIMKKPAKSTARQKFERPVLFFPKMWYNAGSNSERTYPS